MTMYEQDPDVLRWGLHLLCGDPFSNSGYCGATYPNVSDYYSGGYNEENNICTNLPSVEHDELIAHSLQEELSNLAIQDVSESSHIAATEDWFGPSVGTYNSGNDDGQNEENDGELSSSCSSPGENSYDGENWSLELADEYSALDGEVGMRLNQMVPVPHVPKINGEIPSLDEAVSDHQRLLDRLHLYDLVERKVQGDGNCQFRALSDQFYRTSEHHKFVRQQIINQLKSHPEIYEGYVPMEYGDYLRKLSKSGEWGDHVTLQAAADSYGVKIFVITSFKDTCYIEILPCLQKSNRVICLSFWAEVHYNSIYPEGDLPESETKKKRRWWHFKNKP